MGKSGVHSHFFVTPKAGGKVDENPVTQLGRALQELGTKMIPAYSFLNRFRSGSPKRSAKLLAVVNQLRREVRIDSAFRVALGW